MVHYNNPRTQLQQDESDSIIPVEEEITIPSHKGPLPAKQDRVECTKCHKPAVLYRSETRGKIQIIYEHRDEPPIAEFMYEGTKMYRYRRCSGGISQDGLEVIQEAGIAEEEEVNDDNNNDDDDPPASDLIADVPDVPKQKKVHPNQYSVATAIKGHPRPSIKDLYRMVKMIRVEQAQMYKDIHAIKSILEMWMSGVTPKSLDMEDTHGIG